MSIPIRPKRGRETVCPRGSYKGTVESVTEKDESYIVMWLIDTTGMPGGRIYKVPQECDLEDLADVVSDLGIKGETVEVGAIRGTALCHVRTFGGKTESKVVDTDPWTGSVPERWTPRRVRRP